ncbi:MAG TPA: hypothetical protein VGS23_06640, partial [Thermoplasmata archaeon]|nr:hypothetical protein [Thermoplasmata archaeon]
MTAIRRPGALRERLRPLWAGSATLGVLALLLASAFAAQAAVAPSGASPPQIWSHSGQFWYNNSSVRNNSRFSVSYNVSEFYGFNDVITATNTSNTTTEMQGQRWVNDSLVAAWCVPNCTAPRYTESVTVRGWRQASQFLNLTTAATVYENGTAAPALGITNASARGTGNLTETWTVTYGNRSFSENLSESQLSYYSVQFQHALGLIPWNLSTNLTWNATSAYTATGGWNDSFSYGASYNGSMWGRSGSYSGQVNRTGSESLWGRDFGNASIHNRSVVLVGLHFRGPLGFDNDLFMTAVGSDLFQGATANWSVYSHPAYDMAGRAVTGVYTEQASARPSTSTT